MSISASAAESPSTAVGGAGSITSRAGVSADRPSTSTRVRSSRSVISPSSAAPDSPGPTRTTAAGTSSSVIRRATSPTGVAASTSSGVRTISSSTTL